MNNAGYDFKIDNICIPYKLIRSKSKYVRITISGNEMKVSAPKGVALIDIERILEKKSKWIMEKYLKNIELKESGNNKSIENFKSIFFKGEKIHVKITKSEKERIKVLLNKDGIEIFIPNDLSNLQKEEYIKEAIKKYYTEIAKKDVEKWVKYYSNIIGVTYNSLRIKDQKTRWGSCSSKKNLNFNWRLIMFPQWIMNYVIIHELCHLVHLNHSERYWNLVGSYMPNFKEAHKWLKENGKISNLDYIIYNS